MNNVIHIRMKSPSIFIVLVVVFASAECFQLKYACYLMDEQLDFFEHAIVCSREYTQFNVLDDHIEELKKESFPYPLDKKKRILLLHKTYDMVANRMNYFLNKHNSIIKRYVNNLFPDEPATQNLDVEEDLQKEHHEFSLEVKQFFLHEMPDYYYKYAKYLGLQFSSDELDRDKKMYKEIKEKWFIEPGKFANRTGLDESVFSNITMYDITTSQTT